MNCTICRKPLEIDDRIVVSERVTFAFKPANAEHIKSYKVSPNDLIEGGYAKTETATTFLTYDGNPLDSRYFNVKHIECSIPTPKSTNIIFSKNPIIKHSIRYSRNAEKKVNGREVHKHG